MGLERSLSLWQVTLMGIGVILGAGIYVIIGEAAGLSGNAIWMSFFIGSAVACFSGLSYAELSSRFPKAGAEYSYVRKAFGNRVGWIAGWLTIASNIFVAATVSLGFSSYFRALFHTPLVPIAIILLLICGGILYAGVKEAASVIIIFMIIESIGLFIIIAIGIQYVGTVNYLEMAHGMQGVIKGGVLIFFSYLGFEEITTMAEETKNPKKTIPKAILLAIAISTVIYILVGLSAVSIIPWQELSSSNAPLADVASTVFGDRSFIILSGIALFSTFNTVLMSLLAGSRLVYGVAKGRGFPKMFTKTSKKLLSPYIAIIAITIGSIAILFLGDLNLMANLTNFTVFTVFIMVNATLIYFRIKQPSIDKELFRVPGSIKGIPIFPVLGIISSFAMMIYISTDIIVMGTILVIVGIIFSLTLDKMSTYVCLDNK